MADAYVLAHFDDEYLALPMILEGLREGRSQHFLYLVDYADQRLAARRLAETLALFRSLGVAPDRVIHVGRSEGTLDGVVHENLQAAIEALREALGRIAPFERLIAPAWEGGHPDHDVCAVLAERLGREFGAASVVQFSLYNGERLPWRLFRAGSRLSRNGPETQVTLTLGEWVRFALSVRHFPSQWMTWLGLWPAMFLNFVRRGFAYQTLHPDRTSERPHDGPLLYERMDRARYDDLRAAIDALR
jgi:LmbE family N-acetylglucosaminyl deacetylase